jgi:hypothetical protein
VASPGLHALVDYSGWPQFLLEHHKPIKELL